MRKQVAAAMLAGMTMLAGSSALADGMPRGSVKDVPVAVPTWSGFYLGAGLGYGHLIAKNRYNEVSSDFPGGFVCDRHLGPGNHVIGRIDHRA